VYTEFEWQKLPNYIERYKYEVAETTERVRRLEKMLDEAKLGKVTLDGNPHLLFAQLQAMKSYLQILMARADIERVKLVD